MTETEQERIRRDPPLRRASDQTPLGNILGRIEYAYNTGDREWAAELIEREPLASWYGFAPDKFREMALGFTEENIQVGSFIRLIAAMLNADSMRAAAEGMASAPQHSEGVSIAAAAGPPRAGYSFPPETVSLARNIFSLRLSGRPTEALELTAEFEDHFGALQPVFDIYRGWGLFSAVQHGVTAMLAGQFDVAMASFTQARMHVVVPPLAFLTRDACVKAAILQALYGDPDYAIALLEEADAVPRTESWAEDVIDASQVIANAILRVKDPGEAVLMLYAVPLRAIGEMWPFYLVAMQRQLIASGNLEDARSRLARFERLPLSRIDGVGFTGSALNTSAALLALIQGDLIEARARVERADASLPITRIMAATLELVSGRPKVALEHTHGLHVLTRELRFFELWRLAIIAGSHFALGSKDECREVLEHVLSLPLELRAVEASYFPAEVRQFAEETLSNWPKAANGAMGFDLFPLQNEALTSRESDVLIDLARGLSREQIASAQFISLNTLKAHLRSVYRKLGVNSRAAAVLEGERRGLI